MECPPDLLNNLAKIASEGDDRGLECVDALLCEYGEDGRLHFLRGSLLASMKRYQEAQVAMATAIDVAPQFVLARYQLGFLQMTSGDGDGAEETWRGLEVLPEDNALRLLSLGLRHLLHDDFAKAMPLLEKGMARNVDNPPISHDIRLLMSEIDALQTKPDLGGEPASSTQMLLNQIGRRTTRH